MSSEYTSVGARMSSQSSLIGALGGGVEVGAPAGRMLYGGDGTSTVAVGSGVAVAVGVAVGGAGRWMGTLMNVNMRSG